MSQVTVGLKQGLAVDGQVDITGSERTEGFRVESVDLKPGTFVIRGTVDDACTALAGTETAGTDLLGVVCFDSQQEPNQDGSVSYKVGDMVKVLRTGRVAVTTENAATAGGQIFVRKVATGEEVLGAVRATADGTDTIALDLTTAKFAISSDASGQTKIDIDFL